MTNASRVTIFRLLVLGVLVLAATSWAQNRPPISEEIAKTYGLDSFGQIEQIRYTFNLDLPALKLKVARSWVWEPKTGRVSYDGKDKAGKPVKVTYLRSQLSSQDAVVKDEVDPVQQRSVLADLPLPYLLRHRRRRARQRHAKTAAGKGFRQAGVGEVSFSGWLYAGRHLGPVRRVRQPGGGITISPRCVPKTDY